MKVVITGSIAFDYIMTFPGKFRDHLLADQLDKINVSFLVDSMQRFRGGVAPNIAYTNALLGGKPKILAAAGKDFREYGQWLQFSNVDISGVVIFEDHFCASFFVNTDEDQNQIATFYRGAMADASKISISEFSSDADLIVISPNDPLAMINYVKECKILDIPYIFDPSQQIIRLEPEDLIEGLSGSYLLAVNEYELCLILDKTSLSERAILKEVNLLLVTLGDRGAKLYCGDEVHEIPPVQPIKIADPTGAGDAFRGGLIRGIQLGLPWPIAGRMGALASAYVLENSGTQGHSYTINEFVNRYRQHFDDDGFLDRLLA